LCWCKSVFHTRGNELIAFSVTFPHLEPQRLVKVYMAILLKWPAMLSYDVPVIPRLLQPLQRSRIFNLVWYMVSSGWKDNNGLENSKAQGGEKDEEGREDFRWKGT